MCRFFQLLFHSSFQTGGEEASVEKKSEEGGEQEHAESTGDQDSVSGSGAKTGPPETVFSKLMPSENRYTLLRYRDEL